VATLETLIGKQRLWLHIALFIVTLFSTAVAGVAWSGHNPLELENLGYGMEYALLLLLFLSAHEFGHFIAARIHNIDATLPFYIPFPGTMLGIMPNFGTFGAVIKTRSRMTSKKIVFDVGVAGPIAGFIVCVCVLAIGFMTLPGIEYLQNIHPGYPNVASQPGNELVFGKTLLYSFFESLFASKSAYIPPMSEMYHYPMLIVGWFGLFVTGLNLLPVGQLDGGHLTFSMFSNKTHKYVGIGVAAVLALISLPELFISFASSDNFHVPEFFHSLVVPGGSSWIFWVIMIVFFIRFKHPPVDTDEPLDMTRKFVGYFTMLIFVLSFTPSPLVLQ
jgi:membrane-associated protease RseP (regulator of RpoE activity)